MRKSIGLYIPVVVCKINQKIYKRLAPDSSSTSGKQRCKKQTTLTIMPSLVLPYARFRTASILNALFKFETGECTSAQEAALEMGAENVKTFTKYHARAQNGIGRWIAAAASLSPADAEKIVKQSRPFGHSWRVYDGLVRAYADENQKIPGTPLITVARMHEYFQTAFAQKGVGLSPARAACSHPIHGLDPPAFS